MHASLMTYVYMWPTPTARDCKGANGPAHPVNGTGRKHTDQLAHRVAIVENFPRGQLNPEWVEWLMGVPHRVDRIKCLGNAVVPQQFYPVFRAIYSIESNIR